MEGAIPMPRIRAPTEEEIMHERHNLPIAGTQGLSKLLGGRLPTKQVPLESLNVDQSLELLNNAIRIRLQSGPYGLQRCWSQFREKAGGTYKGVNFQQFMQALNKYGLPVPEHVAKEIFDRMDENRNGTICSQEFIDVVMKRWDHRTVTTGHERAHKAAAKSISEQLDPDYLDAKDTTKIKFDDGYLDITKEAKFNSMTELKYGRYLLIIKIVRNMKGGAFGVMRMWSNFRSKCGGTNQGVNRQEFAHGLKMYGLNYRPELMTQIFDSIDTNLSGHIQIFEFIDNLMGRWSAKLNSMQEIGEHEEKVLMKLAEDRAKEKLKKVALDEAMQKKKQKDYEEEIKKMKKRGMKRVPIWKRSARPATAAVAISRQSKQSLAPLNTMNQYGLGGSRMQLQSRDLASRSSTSKMQATEFKNSVKKSSMGRPTSVGVWQPEITNGQGVGDWSPFESEIGQQHLKKEMELYKRKILKSQQSLEDRSSWK